MKLTMVDNLAENKIVLLYILDKFNMAINNNKLFETFCKYDEKINYFYFQQYLFDLQSKNLIDTTLNNETSYVISSKGKGALKNLLHLLPGIIVHKLDIILAEAIPKAKQQTEIIAEYTPINENEYIVTLGIRENDMNLINLELYAGTANQAKSLSKNWQTQSNKKYQEIIEILQKEE